MVQITKKGQKAWVTFSVDPVADESIALCGEWSGWSDEPMKRKKTGQWYLTKVLKVGAEYQFGYKINDNGWRCESDLGCVSSPFGSNNSVLKI